MSGRASFRADNRKNAPDSSLYEPRPFRHGGVHDNIIPPEPVNGLDQACRVDAESSGFRTEDGGIDRDGSGAAHGSPRGARRRFARLDSDVTSAAGSRPAIDR